MSQQQTKSRVNSLQKNQSQSKEKHNNRSIDRSDVQKSRIDHQSPQIKLSVKQERIKNYSQVQKSKVAHREENLEREKVIEQNHKLKKQIQQILETVDTVLQKEQDKRKEAIQKQRQKETDEEVVELKDLLKAQEREIVDNKALIKTIQRKLENTYDINKQIIFIYCQRIIVKENDLKHKQQELKQILDEEESLNKIIKNQREALNYLNNKQEYDVQLSEVKKNYQKAKDQYRDLNEEILILEKQQSRVREQNISKTKKIHELDSKIKEAKKQPLAQVTQKMLDSLENAIKDLEIDRFQEDKKQKDILKQFEFEKHDTKVELEKKILKLNAMEKEMRLNKIFISESVRFTRMQMSQTDQTDQDDRKSEISSKPNLLKKSNASQPSIKRTVIQPEPLNRLKSSEREQNKGSSREQLNSAKQKPDQSVQVENEVEENYDNDFEEEEQQRVSKAESRNSDAKQASQNVESLQSDRTVQLGEDNSSTNQAVYSKPTFMIKKKK